MWLLVLGCLSLQAWSKVVQVQIVHRHGDRVPSVAYSIPKNWVDWSAPPPKGLGLGLGQLTGVGMSQAYALGSWLRDTYITNEELLSEDYRAEDVLVWSTNVDRTLTTAQSLLMGLFPNGTSQSAYNDLDKKWGLPTAAQPIPIHTADKWDYLFQAVDICPEYDMRVQALYLSKMWQDKEKELQPFMDWFRKATEFWWATLKDFYNFYDPVMVSLVHNKLTLTDVKNRFQEIKDVTDWVEYTKKSVGGKLIAAPLLGEIYVESERIMFGNDTKKKFVEYSAHDSTLMSLGITAGWDSDPQFRKIAGYTAAFIFELNNETSLPPPTGLTMVVKFRETDGTVRQIATYSWQQWVWFIGNHTYPNTASWCLACNNTGVGGGYPGAGPCFRELDYFNYSYWSPDDPWDPPATVPPSMAPTMESSPTGEAPTPAAAPTPMVTPAPTNPGETGTPTMPPSFAPTNKASPTEARDPNLEQVLQDTKTELATQTNKVASQNTMIVILSIVLALFVLLSIFLGVQLRNAKNGTNLQSLQQYQAVN